MAPDTNDPVKALFDALPYVEWYEKIAVIVTARGDRRDVFQKYLRTFLDHCQNRMPKQNEYPDPDTAYIFEKARHILAGHGLVAMDGCDKAFLTSLAELALHDGRQLTPSTRSKKVDYMRYAVWVVRGRRDAEHPLNYPSTQPHILPGREHYATLTAQLAKQKERSCSRCGKASTPVQVVRCNRCCVNERYAYVSVAYCDEYCRTADWPQHKATCRSRRLLGRAVSIVQALSHQFETYTFDMSYQSIEVRNDIVKLVEFAESTGVINHAVIPESFKGSCVFRPPPRRILGPQVSDSRDYDESILSYQKCGDLATVEWPFIGLFLDCVCTSVNELLFTPKNASIVVSHMTDVGLANGGFNNHTVLVTQLRSGESFIIDLSGAQYGYREVLATTEDYTASRAAFQLPAQPRGSGREGEAMLRFTLETDSIAMAADTLKQEISSAVAAQVKAFLQSKSLAGASAVARFLSLGQKDFESYRAQLFDRTDSAITSVINKYMSQGMYRLCLNDQLCVRVTDTRDWGRVYQDLWLNEEEWEPIRNQPEKLLKLWHDGLRRKNAQKSIKVGASFPL